MDKQDASTLSFTMRVIVIFVQVVIGNGQKPVVFLLTVILADVVILVMKGFYLYKR